MRHTKTRNLNYITLLTSYEPFKAFVEGLRDELGIPLDGFKEGTDVKNWTEKSDKTHVDYYSSETYKRMVRGVRKKFKDGELDEVMANKQLKVLEHQNPFNRLHDTCKYIMTHFNIPTHFELALSTYILHNKIAYIPTHNFAHIPDVNDKDRTAQITIHAKLEKEELQELIKLIKVLNKTLPTVSKVSDDFMKKLSIENWKNSTHVYDEKISASEIAKENLGENAKPQQVYDTSRLLNKKRKRLFGQKGS